MTDEKARPSGCNCIGSSGNSAGRSFAMMGEGMMRKQLLLHSCCGPCSTAVIERLAPDYEITVYYYNPCITDRDEYEKRKENQIMFIDAYNETVDCDSARIRFIEGVYEPQTYLELVKGHEHDPEGGERCTICFKERLERTGSFAAKHGYPIFGTTLTVSPHKNYSLISEIGKSIAEKNDIEFLDIDFKKKAGFQRSVQLSKEYGLYRQDYCGCSFSKNKFLVKETE